MVLVYTIFNIYAALSGFKDGVLYSKKGSEAFKWNEHLLFVAERGAVVMAIIGGIYLKPDIWFLIPAVVLSFPFWHDGFYYLGRHYIDVKEYRFNSDSKTSTADLEFSFLWRCILNIVSIVLILIYVFK